MAGCLCGSSAVAGSRAARVSASADSRATKGTRRVDTFLPLPMRLVVAADQAAACIQEVRAVGRVTAVGTGRGPHPRPATQRVPGPMLGEGEKISQDAVAKPTAGWPAVGLATASL